jgi:hypothetical protein
MSYQAAVKLKKLVFGATNLQHPSTASYWVHALLVQHADSLTLTIQNSDDVCNVSLRSLFLIIADGIGVSTRYFSNAAIF